jgi:hypothetical protein
MTDEVKQNPATGKLPLPKGYRPMSVGQRRLEVPPIEGYHLHWFRGSPSNISRALQAGYAFVEPEEVSLNDLDLGGGDGDKGTDLGNRVSVVSGDDVGHNGQPGRLYLMKCPTEWYEHAQGLLASQVDATADALRGGKVGVSQDGQETRTDAGNRYLKEMKAPLLTRKT